MLRVRSPAFASSHLVITLFRDSEKMEAGQVEEGDQLQLLQRPHPEWSLHRIGDLLYSQAHWVSDGICLKYPLPLSSQQDYLE